MTLNIPGSRRRAAWISFDNRPHLAKYPENSDLSMLKPPVDVLTHAHRLEHNPRA